MPVPKRSASPPKRVWVILSQARYPVAVCLSEEQAAAILDEDETVYRYDLHKG